MNADKAAGQQFDAYKRLMAVSEKIRRTGLDAEKAIAEGANLKRVGERERRFRKRQDKF